MVSWVRLVDALNVYLACLADFLGPPGVMFGGCLEDVLLSSVGFLVDVWEMSCGFLSDV